MERLGGVPPSPAHTKGDVTYIPLFIYIVARENFYFSLFSYGTGRFYHLVIQAASRFSSGSYDDFPKMALSGCFLLSDQWLSNEN